MDEMQTKLTLIEGELNRLRRTPAYLPVLEELVTRMLTTAPLARVDEALQVVGKHKQDMADTLLKFEAVARDDDPVHTIEDDLDIPGLVGELAEGVDEVRAHVGRLLAMVESNSRRLDSLEGKPVKTSITIFGAPTNA